MSDRLAPLIERQGPWLLRVWSTQDDSDVWAAYVKLTEETRAFLLKWQKFVKETKKANNLFHAVQFWNPVELRLLNQSAGRISNDLEAFVEPFINCEEDQVLVVDRFVENVESLEALRTSTELMRITDDGVDWEATNKYCNHQYYTNTLPWEDI